MAAPAPARRPPPPPPPPPPESALPPAAPRSPAAVPPPAPPGPKEPAFVPPALPGHYARGDAIGDSYRVEKVLGEGGFGIVYLVQARRGGGRVAVKTIRDEWLRDDATRAMFRKEAELWIALGRHPYLVRADFVDEEHGRLFLVMEYIAPDARGMSGLSDRLERDPPDLDQALRFAVQFCHGMEYAYSRGIRCHRDIKPANILIGTDGAVRITDFGIAGVVAPGAEAPPAARVEGMGGTVAGAVFGTPTHMPPEQFVDAASCDERSDIYSFGVVLYQMAARGALPFLAQVAPGPDAGRRFFAGMRHLHETAEPLPLDSPLMPVIARCLQKDRGHRYPAFAALRADLEHLLRERTGEEVKVPQGGKTAAEDLCQRGISMASLGRHQEALACYDEALALSPDEPNLHNNRGNALSNLGRLDEALGAFARAIDLRPRHDSAFANRALAYARASRFAEALRDCDLALALNARSSEAWQARGVALSNLGRRDESIAAYDAALAIDARDPLAWGNKAGELLEAGRLAESIECYDRALALDPHAQARWVGKATALGQMGRNEESLPCFDEALRLDPKNPQAYYNKGNSLVQLQRYEEALSHFTEANRLAPRVAVVWYNRAVCELVLHLPQQAGASLRRYLSLDPPEDSLTDQARWFLHGIDTGELKGLARGQGPPKPGELRSAEEMKEKAPVPPASAAPDATAPTRALTPPPPPAVASPPPRPPAPAAPKAVPAPPPPPRVRPALGPSVRDLNNEGDGHFQAGRFSEALATFERALELDPFGAVALGNRANALFKLGKTDEAIAGHERALACDPFFLPSWASKAAIEQMSGRRAAALGSYREVVALAEEAQGAMRADAHAKAQRLEQAGVKAPPRSPLGWLGAGAKLGAAGRFAEAIDALDRALAEAPDLTEAWLMKAEALRQLKRTGDATALVEDALRRRPEDPLLWHARAIDLKNQERQEEAVAAFDRALALEPRHAASWSDRGRSLGALKRLDEGIESLERAIALRPDAAPPWLNKALIEEEARRPADAAHSFRMFIERATPEHRLQVEMAKDHLALLEPLVGEPVRTTPPPPPRATPPPPPRAMPPPPPGGEAPGEASAGQRGLEALRESRFDEAWILLEEAVTSPSADAADWTNLGLCRGRLGYRDLAMAAYDRALSLDPRYVAALTNKASLVKERGDENAGEESLALLMRAAVVAPENVLVWINLAIGYASMGVHQLAVEACDNVLEIDPLHAEALEMKADALGRLKRPEESLAAAEQALELEPRRAHAFYLKANALAKLGRKEECLLAYDSCLALDPKKANAHYNKAYELFDLKRYDDIPALCARAVQLHPGFSWAAELGGRAHEALGQHDQALAGYDAAAAIDAQDTSPWSHKALLLQKLKRYPEALLAFDRALALLPKGLHLLAGKAECLEEAGRPLEAVASWQRWLMFARGSDPKVAVVRAKLLSLAKQRMIPMAAPPSGGGAVPPGIPGSAAPAVTPTTLPADALKKGLFCQNQGQHERAVEWFDVCLKGDAGNVGALAGKGDSLRILARYDLALPCFEQALAKNPAHAPTWLKKGLCLDAMSRLEDALVAFDQAAANDPKNSVPWTSRGLALARMGRPEEALQSFDKALAVDPRAPLPRFHAAEVFEQVGRNEDAAKAYQQFLGVASPAVLAGQTQRARKRLAELRGGGA